jgi:hypothetical protein
MISFFARFQYPKKGRDPAAPSAPDRLDPSTQGGAFVIGVGEGITKWGDMEFAVQPVAVKKGKDGKLTFEDLPGGGSLKTNMTGENGEIERSQNGVVASPQLTIKMPEGAGAVKITVKEAFSKKSFDVMLPLLDSGSSAVLNGILDGSDCTLNANGGS